MAQNNRRTSGRGQPGAAGQSEMHGHSLKSRRDEKEAIHQVNRRRKIAPTSGRGSGTAFLDGAG